jgi:thiol-disulfide isomerase/thioredoxin
MLLEPAVLLSSRPLNSVFLGLALLAAGCDRQSGDKAQPQASGSPATAPTKNASVPGTAGQGIGALTGTIDRSHKGEPLPDLTVKDPAGRALRLKELKGPVLINLWATWCAPCVTELPLLDQLADDRAEALRIVTVSQDLGDGAKIAEFLKGKGLRHLEPWLDPKNDLIFRYGGGTLPTTVYYDAAGREVWRLVGGHDWSNAETAKLLAEK